MFKNEHLLMLSCTSPPATMVRGCSNNAKINDGAFSLLGKRNRVANIFASLSMATASAMSGVEEDIPWPSPPPIRGVQTGSVDDE